MILDINPGSNVTVRGTRYTAEEHSTFHEVDFRLDLVRLSGERWLVAVLAEPHLFFLQRLQQDWLAPPLTSVTHGGEIFVNLYRGSAHPVRRTQSGRSKENRMEYALFRANSGRVILTLGRNEEIEAWIGDTLPSDATDAA